MNILRTRRGRGRAQRGQARRGWMGEARRGEQKRSGARWGDEGRARRGGCGARRRGAVGQGNTLHFRSETKEDNRPPLFLTCTIQTTPVDSKTRTYVPLAGRDGAGRGGAQRRGEWRGRGGRGAAGRAGMAADGRAQDGGGTMRPGGKNVCPPGHPRQPSRTSFRRHEQTKSYVNRTEEHNGRMMTGWRAADEHLKNGSLRSMRRFPLRPGCWPEDRYV